MSPLKNIPVSVDFRDPPAQAPLRSGGDSASHDHALRAGDES